MKVLVHHPERRFPSYRDWESRWQCAIFDCSRAQDRLSSQPGHRFDLIYQGIDERLIERYNGLILLELVPYVDFTYWPDIVTVHLDSE